MNGHPTRLTTKRTQTISKKAAECDLEAALGQRVGEPRAVGRGEARDRRHQRKTDERDEADRERRQQRLLRQARNHVADRAGDGDRHAKRGRGRDCAVDRPAVQGEDHVGDRAAADAHQRGGQADEEAIAAHGGAARQVVGEPPAVAADQELQGDHAPDQHEGELEHRGRRKAGDGGARRHADHGRHGPLPHHVHHHRALVAVDAEGEHVGRHDDRDRGPDAELEAHLVRHAEHAEHLVEDRNDEGAAADAEQPGQDAGDDAGDDDQGGEQQQLAHRHAKHHFRLRRSPPAGAADTWLSLYFNYLLIHSTERVEPRGPKLAAFPHPCTQEKNLRGGQGFRPDRRLMFRRRLLPKRSGPPNERDR